MKKYVIVLASGSSSRFGSGERPKQFVEVMGKTILEHTLDACDCEVFDEMVVVVPELNVKEVTWRINAQKYSIPLRVVAGGGTRLESCRHGVNAIEDYEAYVVIHNGAQPLVTKESFQNCLLGLETADAVTTAVPCVYTVLEIDEQGYVTSIPDRSTLRNDMGVEGFKLSLLRKLFLSHMDSKSKSTDMVGEVLKSGLSRVRVVEGDENNIKITYQSDMEKIKERLVAKIKGKDTCDD